MVSNQPSNEEVIEKIDSAFDSVDHQRAAGLADLNTWQTARNAAAEREQQRLVQKYGADHPRVNKLTERIAFNEGLKSDLDAEMERAKNAVPSFDVNSWMVHGQVLNQDGQGISGLTASLYDENGRWLELLGYGCTDERGYFAVRYRVESGQEPKIPGNQPLTLTVTDNQFTMLHQETEPLFVQLGTIDYRLIVLKETGGTCIPPEPGTGPEPDLSPDAWMVKGTVVYGNDQPASGLVVSMYDKDLFFDDALGTTLTDDSGHFTLIYRTEAFRDLFESQPDLYLKIFDKQGEILYSTTNTVRTEAGRVENYDIKIERKMDEGKS